MTQSQDNLRKIVALEKAQEKIEKMLKSFRTAALEALIAGNEFEPGLYNAEIAYDSRRTVAWKAIVERKLGAAYAKRVIAATKPTKTPKLKITEAQRDTVVIPAASNVVSVNRKRSVA